MFHTLKGHTTAVMAALCLSFLATASYAEDPKSSVEQTQSVLSQVKDMSLADIRFETKSKLSETQQWVEGAKVEQNFEYLMNDFGKTVDKFQDKVAPAGQSLKSFIRKKLPGESLVQAGDRTVTVYGLLLILSFAIVVFLMSAANPASRLGGRH